MDVSELPSNDGEVLKVHAPCPLPPIAAAALFMNTRLPVGFGGVTLPSRIYSPEPMKGAYGSPYSPTKSPLLATLRGMRPYPATPLPGGYTVPMLQSRWWAASCARMFSMEARRAIPGSGVPGSGLPGCDWKGNEDGGGRTPVITVEVAPGVIAP